MEKSSMMRTWRSVLFLVVAMLAGNVVRAESDRLAWLDACNVVWDSPSANSGESMPVGGGDIGLNVWVEDGEILFYVAQAGCRDENGALLKHGRVRVSLSPNPLAKGGTFRQELKLRQGYVEIQGRSDQAGEATVRIWVEVHRPVVHVDVESAKPITTTAAFETWRYQDTFLYPANRKYFQVGMAMMNRTSFPGKVWLYQDTIIPETHSLNWFHRMQNDKGIFEYAVRQQGLEAVRDKLYDPLTDLTFGGTMVGENFVADGTTKGVYAQTSFKGWRYRSEKPSKQHNIRLFCHIDQTETLDQWKKGLKSLATADSPTDKEALAKNIAWWGQFWNRSHIIINPKADPDDQPWQVSRNYNLFRYTLACNLTGREPMMFNGGPFTFDPLYVPGSNPAGAGPDAVDKGWTPDHRNWGAGFTAQNQRLMYWTMLRSGDFDVMLPGLDYYRLGLASASARVKQYWGHDGACFVEQISAQALPGAAMWGFAKGGPRGRPGNLEHGVQVNGATRYLYQAQLEFAHMTIKWHRYTNNDIAPYLPFIDASVRFYDQHYRMRKKKRDGKELDDNGRIVIEPSRACEDYKGAINPADATAGLHAVLSGLLKLDDRIVPPQKKAEYKEMYSRLPVIPTTEMDGDKVIMPAANLKTAKKREIPELYPLFPYDVYGLDRDLEVARNTWKHTGGSRNYSGWYQGSIFTARLGLSDQAAAFAIKKLGNANRRFPASMGSPFCWVPDNDWGSTGMIGLQEMLVQSHGRKIWLLPAWPKDWDVDFKLHAPFKTTIEARVAGGKIVKLKVTPQARRDDVIIMHDGSTPDIVQPQ